LLFLNLCDAISRKGIMSIKQIESQKGSAQVKPNGYGYGQSVFDLTGLQIDGKEMDQTVTLIRRLAGRPLNVYFSRVMEGMHAVLYLKAGVDEYYKLEAHDSYRKSDRKRINLTRLSPSRLKDSVVNSSPTMINLNCQKTIHDLLNSNGVTDEEYNDNSNCSTFVHKVLTSVNCITDKVRDELKDTLRLSRDEGFNDFLTKAAEGKITF